MKRYVRLSYDIGRKTPLYPGTPEVTIERLKDMANGDHCNTYKVAFSNHTGTHIDAPGHFYDDGRRIGGYSPEDLVFYRPLIIDVPKEAGEAIEADDLAGRAGQGKPDALLIRTGFQKYRQADPERYRSRNPYLSAAAAEYLKRSLPGLRAIALDCISVASHSNRDAGIKTHRILLKEEGPERRAILLIEDIYYPQALGPIDELIVMPVFMEEVDSSPCTVIGVIND
ncbi:MAG: cyclase family protein [Candidatus Omnitrophota bacterium]|jgi:kynurenine formamidase